MLTPILVAIDTGERENSFWYIHNKVTRNHCGKTYNTDGLENIYNTTVMGDFRFGVGVNLVSFVTPKWWFDIQFGIQCQTLTPRQNIIHYPWHFLVASTLSKNSEELF